jgi:putative Holliday junction resolvase
VKNNEPSRGRILSLDFGQKSVGVAISDEDRTMVFGRGVIKNFKSLADLFEKVKSICEKEAVVEIVVGLPVNPDGEDTFQTARIRGFGLKLEEFIKTVPVKFEDESFSSFEADSFLSNVAKVKGSERKKTEDEIAAVVILKRYLDLEEV